VVGNITKNKEAPER